MLADRALFWPRHRALIVADLHLEKASWYAAHGQPLPPYDSHDTLERLIALVAATEARAVWCLGDSLHDRAGAARLPLSLQHQLRNLSAQAQLIWVAGNHDGISAGTWGGDVADELCVDGITFRHQAEEGADRPEISGHYHPKLRLSVRGRRISRPCFAVSSHKVILPAFGSLTGGLNVFDPVIAGPFAGPYHAMLVASGQRLSFPSTLHPGTS